MQVAQGGFSYTTIDPVELRARLSRGESFAILDMRSDDRYLASGETLAGAIRLAPDSFAGRTSEVPRGRTPVVICDPESTDAVVTLLGREGYHDVWVIEGGFEAFRKAGGGLVRIGR